MDAGGRKKAVYGVVAVVAMAAAYIVYQFQDSIPELGDFSIASVIIATLLGGAAGAVLGIFGVDTRRSKERDA